MTETTLIATTPAGQFKLGCSGQLAPNVAARVSSLDVYGLAVWLSGNALASINV